MSGRDRRRKASAFAGFLVLLFGLVATRSARAELSFDGKWRQSALKDEYTVQQWLQDGCGPAPSNSSTGGGEIVSIKLEGDELTIVGGGRVYHSNQCYDPMPGLARASHSRDANGKTWRTRCATPPSDARNAILNTLVVVTTDTHIDMVETGRYTIQLENGRCMADVRRTRSWDLVSDAQQQPTPAPAPTTAPTEKPEPKPSACAYTGEPARLEVRPSKKLLRTGESFTFRAAVLDEKGCGTRTATTWKLAPGADGKGVTVDAHGKVTIAKDALEGTVEVVATAAGKDARVVIEVASPAHYEDLLARSGLNASGENDAAAVATLGTESIGAGEGRVEDHARRRRMLFLGIVGVALVVLGGLTVVLLRRSRRAKELEHEAETRHEARIQAALDRRKQREAEHAAQQRAHDESVAAVKVAEEARAAAAAAAAAASASTTPRRGKICPRCGDRFDGQADFCGKDGTKLVLIN